jgi:PKD repeat protein
LFYTFVINKFKIPATLRKITIFIYSYFVCLNCYAQNPLVKQWDYRFGGTAYEQLFSFKQTKDGGYILGGGSDSDSSGDKTQGVWGTNNEKDYWIIKIDSLGIKQWDKNLGGLETDWFEKVQQTSDGGYILGGTSTSNIGGDKSDSLWGGYSYDFWIVKVDSLGNKEWDKNYGGFSMENFASLQQTTDGGYILGGSSMSIAGGDKSQGLQGYGDYWIIKIDSLGNKQWDKDFGGTQYDNLYSVVQTADGGYLLGGYSASNSSGDKTQNVWGYADYWIVKIDSLGNKMWDKDFGGTGDDWLSSILPTTDGGYLLGGKTTSGISGNKSSSTWGGWDYWIVKIDSSGNKLWDKDFGSTHSDYLFSVENTNDGGYLIAGTTDEHFMSGDKSENSLGLVQTWAVKTDSLGNKQWDKTIFTANQGGHGAALQSNDGCYVFADWEQSGVGGYKTQPNWAGNSDYWIVKFCDSTQTAVPTAAFSSDDSSYCGEHCFNFTDLSPNSPTSWAWSFPGALPDTSNDQNPQQICYSTPGTYTVTLVASNSTGSSTAVYLNFITIYGTPTTPFITVTGPNGDTLTSTPALSYQWNGNGQPIAGATSQVYVAPWGGTYTVTTTDANNCSATSFPVQVTGISEYSHDINLNIKPNPVVNDLEIDFNLLAEEKITFNIKNPLGQNLLSYEKIFQTGNFNELINLNKLDAGIYFLTLKFKDGCITRKLIKSVN